VNWSSGRQPFIRVRVVRDCQFGSLSCLKVNRSLGNPIVLDRLDSLSCAALLGLPWLNPCSGEFRCARLSARELGRTGLRGHLAGADR